MQQEPWTYVIVHAASNILNIVFYLYSKHF